MPVFISSFITGESTTNDSYLRDAHGNEITPSIEGQQFLRRTKAEMRGGIRQSVVNSALLAKRTSRSDQDVLVGDDEPELAVGDPGFKFDVGKHTYFPKSVRHFRPALGIWAVKPDYNWLTDDDPGEDLLQKFRQRDAAFEEWRDEYESERRTMAPVPTLIGYQNSPNELFQQP